MKNVLSVSLPELQNPAERYLTPDEVMERLAYKSRSAFWIAVRANRLPYVRITARKILFPESQLSAWLQHRTAGRIAA